MGYITPQASIEPKAIQLQAAVGALWFCGVTANQCSVEQTHAVLHRALCQAMHWGLIATNPTELVAPPRPRKREMTPLTTAQLQRLLDDQK